MKLSSFCLIRISTFAPIMEYLNEFHKAWIEKTRQSIASWSKQPASFEEVRQQQERLNQQRAIREGKLRSKWEVQTSQKASEPGGNRLKKTRFPPGSDTFPHVFECYLKDII